MSKFIEDQADLYWREIIWEWGKKSVRNLFVSLSRAATGQKKALIIANKEGKLTYRKGGNFFPICKMFMAAISSNAPLGLWMWSGWGGYTWVDI